MTIKNERRSRPLLSVEEAAELLGQSRSSLYRAVERGDLPFPVFTINGRYRIALRSVEQVIAGDLGSPAAPSGATHTKSGPGAAATSGSAMPNAGQGRRSMPDPTSRPCDRRLGGPRR